ncbi:MAG TPA: hypothetical protein VGF59_11750 [Bryobacteraceae bacterium]|jgi:hypothetical protein
MACAMVSVSAPAGLISIRRGYATDCRGLRLAVETDADGWTAQVTNALDGRTVYNARRCSLRAAQVAATEFALWFGGGGKASPEAVAGQLGWREYW